MLSKIAATGAKGAARTIITRAAAATGPRAAAVAATTPGFLRSATPIAGGRGGQRACSSGDPSLSSALTAGMAAPFTPSPSFAVERVAGALGAEVRGVDIATITDAEWEAVHEAAIEHLVLFFHGQHDLSPETHRAFAARFGELEPHTIVKGLSDEYPEVVQIVKAAGEATKFGETWHTDNSFTPRPTSFSILRSVEVPPFGNDTLWASMYAAYDGLSDGMKASLGTLRAVHGAGRAFGLDDPERRAKYEAPDDDPRVAMKYKKAMDVLTAEVEHPIVRTHPVTGRPALYVNSMFTYRISGWTEAESAPLIEWLLDHCAKPEYTVRFRWSPGCVALWDNRCTQHVAMNDNNQHRRVMQRVCVKGERPF